MTHGRNVVLFAMALATASPLGAQSVVVREGRDRRTADIIRDVSSRPHTVRSGTDSLVLPRDSTVSGGLLIIGRPTYVASRVEGDVVVVGSDLFLRPGADITGRAIAIGGTVALTTLGRVAGDVESIRDETYRSTREGDQIVLDYRDLREGESSAFQLAGLQGFLIPSYDRVNGLSLPVGALLTLGERAVEVQPTLTYRSRLGLVDPAVALRVHPGRNRYVEARLAIDTRSNDRWIRSDLVNSATSFVAGSDTRNYFRSTGGEGRAFLHLERRGFAIDPFIGGRYERVRPITAAGNVFSLTGRKNIERGSRPNPLVDPGSIGSVLLGAAMFDTTGVVKSRLRAEAEQSVSTSILGGRFLQFTVDGRVAFPTFRKQTLRIIAHGVATSGDTVPKARYAYLGGGGTLPLLDLLEQGGTKLVFMESRYLIPLVGITLPFVGEPIIILRHFIGAAGVGALPRLEQEVGVGLGVNVLTLDFVADAGGGRKSRFRVGISPGR